MFLQRLWFSYLANASRRVNFHKAERRIDNPYHAAAGAKILVCFLNRVLGGVAGRNDLHCQGGGALYWGTVQVNPFQVFCGNKGYIGISNGIRGKTKIHFLEHNSQAVGFYETD